VSLSIFSNVQLDVEDFEHN